MKECHDLQTDMNRTRVFDGSHGRMLHNRISSGSVVILEFNNNDFHFGLVWFGE